MVQNKEVTKSNPLSDQAVAAVDWVAYQDGAVVSREVVDKKTGSVTLFAFAEGQGLREHTVPYDALVYLLDGEADITIAGKVHRVHIGDMLLMPGHQPHALKAVKPFKMILTMIRT